MNDLMIFENKKFGKVRTVEINNEPWFVGKDVAEALGFANPQKAIRDHVEEEDKKVNESFTLGQGSSPVLINESGLYSLIFGSKLDSAKEFKHWVISEVLPVIRKSNGERLRIGETVTQDLTLQENKPFNTRFELGCVDCFEESNTLWFRLSDIGKILDLSDSTVRKMKHDGWFDDDEITTVTKSNGGSDITYVSESALYRILNRSNSPKAKPFERWVTKEVIPSIRKTRSYVVPAHQKSEAEIGLERAKFYSHLSDKYSGKSATWSQILDAYATKEMSGQFLLPLPKMEEKNYSATEVGNKLGISSKMVGKIANRLGIKVDGEYGKWYIDKSPYSNKEVNTFRYTDEAVRVIERELAS